jgi:excisionase family DNA binding protein
MNPSRRDARPLDPAARPSLITTRQLSAALSTSERQVQRMASRLPHYRVGRQLRFDLEEVRSALRSSPTVEPELGRLALEALRLEKKTDRVATRAMTCGREDEPVGRGWG